jgi:serine/threonine-protein kinase RsbW
VTGTWPAVVDSVPLIRRTVVGFAETEGATARALDNIALAVSEAAANAAVHGFLGMPVPGSIVVTAESSASRVLVVVTDDGTGLSPRSDSPGLGLGLIIIAEVTDALEIVSGAEGGTELRMEFALAA